MSLLSLIPYNGIVFENLVDQQNSVSGDGSILEKYWRDYGLVFGAAERKIGVFPDCQKNKNKKNLK